MISKVLTVFLLLLTTIQLNGQTEYSTENSSDIYWQPNTQINFSDYQSQSDSSCIKYNKKYGLQMSSSIGFRGIVDVLNKKGNHSEIFYLAPVFCKKCSCILSEDSLNLQVDRLLFDVAELSVRSARRELLAFQEKMKSDNTYSLVFTTVQNKWEKYMRSTFGTIIREVLIEKKEGAYTSWRQTIDDVSLQTKKYATTPKDCYRFVVGKPIDEGYQMAPTIMDDLFKE